MNRHHFFERLVQSLFAASITVGTVALFQFGHLA